MKEANITINLDAKCRRCGKGGATQNGFCLLCINKALQSGEFDHLLRELRDKTKGAIKKVI